MDGAISVKPDDGNTEETCDYHNSGDLAGAKAQAERVTDSDGRGRRAWLEYPSGKDAGIDSACR